LANNREFSWRRKTHKAQLTRHLLKVIIQLQAYAKWKIKLLAVQPANVYNADQTNVFFSRYTLADRGSRTVSIKGADSSARLTAMLCTNKDGGKVDPFLIFKGLVKNSGRLIKQLDQMERGVFAQRWVPIGTIILGPTKNMDG
jgi:hypothetical protein